MTHVGAPILTVFAGPNGSGKSTLQAKIVSEGHDLGPFINADVIEKAIRLSDATTRPDREYHIAAFEEATRQRERALEAGRSFSFETVFSHESKVDLLARARRAGFFVRLFFVATEDARLNIARVAYRVRAGGHNVAADKVAVRYHRALALLPRALDHVDECVLFDNSARQMRPVATYRCDEHGSREFELSRDLPRWVATLLSQYADRWRSER